MGSSHTHSVDGGTDPPAACPKPAGNMRDVYESLTTSAVAIHRDAVVARVSGPDRVAWLQGMVSNDVAGLGPGSGCYAAHLNSRGKVLSLMRVLADEEALWLELDGDSPQRVAELDKWIVMEDAEILDHSEDVSVLAIVGAGARPALEAWTGSRLELARPYDHTVIQGVRILRGDLGFDLIVPRPEVESVLEGLAGKGVRLAEKELWNLLTLEAGLPQYGVDVDEQTTLPELGQKGIDYRKGCYVGQEVVAKIKYIGHVNRHFAGIRIAGDAVPPAHAAVQRNGKAIGKITRARRSPDAGGVVALGYVRLGNEAPGTGVQVEIEGGTVEGEVSSLPFLVRSWD